MGMSQDQIAIKSLTDGQRECLLLVAQHLTSKEIARLLGVSKDTVDQRITLAMRKLGVTSRAEAARKLMAQPLYDRMVYDTADMAIVTAGATLDVSPGDALSSAGGKTHELSSGLFPQAHYPVQWSGSLPITTQRGAANELSLQARLGWMLAIPIATGAIALQLVSLLDGLSRLIGR